MSVELQYKSPKGHIMSIVVEELISVDGRPYRESAESTHDILVAHETRIATLEQFMFSQVAQPIGA